MARSLKKGPYIDDHLERKILHARETGDKKIIKTWSRRSMVIPETVGLTIAVHNGKKFVPVFVTENLQEGFIGQNYYQEIKAKDGNNDELLFTAFELPPGLIFSDLGDGSAIIEGIPQNHGETSITIFVTDGIDEIQKEYSLVINKATGIRDRQVKYCYFSDDFLYCRRWSGGLSILLEQHNSCRPFESKCRDICCIWQIIRLDAG